MNGGWGGRTGDCDLALLRLAHKHNPATIGVQLAAASAAVVAVLAARGSLLAWYGVWLGGVFLIGLLRLLGHGSLGRRLEASPDPSRRQLRAWATLHGAGLLASGGLWTLLACLRLPVEDAQTRYVILIILSALAAGATGVLAPLRFTGPAYITLLLVPACGSLLLQGSGQAALGAVGLVFWAVMMAGHRNNRALLVHSIEVGRENLAMVEQLTRHSEEVEQINQSLERRVAERTEALEILTIEAQAANRAKSEFLATMSHEIRTPLNGVLGMAQVMAGGALAPQQREHLSLIQASAESLMCVINDVLDISKIEAGRMEIVSDVFDLARFTEGLERLYGALAHQRGLSFSVVVQGGAMGWRQGDEPRLRQILANLISNALKFTEQGAIHLEVGCGGDEVVFAVRDTGIGIAPEDQAAIFDPFVQADGSSTRRSGGSGLGLAICRKLATLMGGEITVASVSGEGSCFTVRLPLPRAAPPAPRTGAEGAGVAADMSAPAGSGEGGAEGAAAEATILVVDDNETNRLVLQTLLCRVGLVCAFAHDGVQAVQAWRDRPWELILMDINMPHLDGLGATRRIRALESGEARARTPIIAVTASVLARETGAYYAAGMDDVVPKPLDARVLVEAVSRQLASRVAA